MEQEYDRYTRPRWLNIYYGAVTTLTLGGLVACLAYVAIR